jgi:ParB family chromosome partitioning protein
MVEQASAPSELVAIGEAIEEREREAARRRQSMAGGTAPGKLPEAVKTGDTRDKTAASVGVSGRTYEKAKAVVEAAEREPERFADLVEEMDRSGKCRSDDEGVTCST